MKDRSYPFILCLFALLSGCYQPLTTQVSFEGTDKTEFLEKQAASLLPDLRIHGLEKITFRKSRKTLPDRESYRVVIDEENELVIESTDYQGALYAVLDTREQLLFNNNLSFPDNFKSPSLSVRAIKFNLPWSAYRESKSMEIHEKTCRDLSYWRAFFDMMLENRFNTLLLYNKHPFPFMVKLEEYPEACPFSEQEMVIWQNFWQDLMAMGKERAIEVFVVNWNIIVSPSFAAAHHVEEYNDTSQIVIDYTKKSVTALINTYPDLAGIGVTLADWMNGLSPERKEKWIEETFVAGMKEANREVKFLHRAVLSGSSDEMRNLLNRASFSQPSYTEVKFNWSHGHSTPHLLLTHASEAGEVNTGFWDPLPENYHIQWMIRNEDFFILRWGDPNFIRQHIALNSKPFVNGYHLGSEGYIPAFNYLDKAANAPEYAFERQWLFYQLWGKLLYDEYTADAQLAALIDRKFKTKKGNEFLKAYTYASKMPLLLASYFKSTWDYTLYAEGFLAPMMQTRYGFDDQYSPFISLPELMEHQTLDTNYLSIEEFEHLRQENQNSVKISPLQLADQLLIYTDSINYFLKMMQPEISGNSAMAAELVDLEMWAYLSTYFSLKLKAATLLAQYQNDQNQSLKNEAIRHLETCYDLWSSLAALGELHYHQVPYWESRVFRKDSSINDFSWRKYLPEVERDLLMVTNNELK